MEKPAQNIQDSFLNNARKDKIVLTMYLMSGVKLSGRIKSFDKYSLVLETNNQEQLIFKHAISTVVSRRPCHAVCSLRSGRAAPRAHRTVPECRLTRILRRLRPRPARAPRRESGPSWSVSNGRAAARPDRATLHGAEESLEELAELAASAGADDCRPLFCRRAGSRGRHADRPRQGRKNWQRW